MNKLIHDTTLYEDIPSPEGREEKEMAVYRLLSDLGIPYERMDHEAMDTMEACQGVDEILHIHMCKNLFLCNSQKTVFYLLLMPGEKKFKTKELSKQIGSARLSFASEEYMVKYLNIRPGSVSIMGLMNDTENCVQLLIDKDILASELVGCHPCVNTSSLSLRVRDLIDVFLPAVGHSYITVRLSEEA